MKEIKLTRGYVAIVDNEDFERVNRHKWAGQRHGLTAYAKRSVRVDGKQSTAYMHRFILGVTDPLVEVDHINHNGLDNRRANLRPCTPSQNQCNHRLRLDNTSGARGVSWERSRGKWRAQTRTGGKALYIGLFASKREAADAYAKAVRELHGEFANPATGQAFELPQTLR